MSYQHTAVNWLSARDKGIPVVYRPDYRCSSYKHRGGTLNPFGCATHHIRASQLETIVEKYLDAIGKTLSGQDGDLTGGTVRIEQAPMSFDEQDPQERIGIEEEIARLEAENKRVWDIACKCDTESAFQNSKDTMRGHDKRIAELKKRLAEMAERLTPDEMLRRVEAAKQTLRDSNYRAKKEAVAKVIDRIDCYFERFGLCKYRLSSVKIIPVTVEFQASDTPEETVQKTDLLEQQKIGLTGLEQDGVKSAGNVRFTTAGVPYEGGRMRADVEISAT